MNPYDWAALREQRLSAMPPEARASWEQRVNSMLPFEVLGLAGLRGFLDQFIAAELTPGVSLRDIEVPGPAGPVPVRIYKPDDAVGPLGICIHHHGGGFVAGGGFRAYDAFNSQLAKEANCLVVHPDFRLPPEHKFPAAIEDCWAVLNWIAKHGAEFGGDPGKIAVGGGCTGATHSTVMALMARDAGGPEIKFQWLFDAYLDARFDYQSQIENGEGYFLTLADNKWVTRRYLEHPEQRWDWRVSPMLADSLRGVAPALIIAGECDILRDEMRHYANRLRDAGVPVEHRCYPGEGHAFSSGHRLDNLSHAGRDAHARRIAGLKLAFA
ncbi:acetyl esterase [Bradyrhizobium elkanii]|uniref:alpha/beta hydrolase n=1 Tax=Bradyrhizobium elkanii TaxID=29448 RepID=UPI003515EF63